LAFLWWLGLAILWLWNLRGVKVLTAAGEAAPDGKSPGQWPRISVLVPARNEEAALPACLESLLKLEYPDYEIILVDDDSTDATGRIGDDWERRPESTGRLKVIHNHEVAAGWSGKVHALSLAERAATGGWLLATDADVVFHPAVLRVAMARALREGVDLLSIVPQFEFSSFWEKMVLPAFSFLLSTLFPMRAVNNPKSRKALAAGAFILMRAETFRELGGYESIRRAVTEDLRTAQLFKRGGHRIFLAPTRGLLRTRMYASGGELFEGLSRSAFEGTGFSISKILGGVIIGIVTSMLPWVVALVLGLSRALAHRPSGPDPALVLALATCALSAVIYLPVLFFLRISPLYVFTLPLAAIFYAAVSLASMWRSLAGRGVSWKERYYRAPEEPPGESKRS
jgi:hopene-associated glycosyltransferase HpnB